MICHGVIISYNHAISYYYKKRAFYFIITLNNCKNLYLVPFVFLLLENGRPHLILSPRYTLLTLTLPIEIIATSLISAALYGLSHPCIEIRSFIPVLILSYIIIILSSVPGPKADLPINRTILNLLDLPESGSPDASILSSSPRKCPVCLTVAADLMLCPHCNRNVCAACRSNHQRQLRSDVGHSLEQLRKVVKDLRRGSMGLEDYKAQLQTNLKRTEEEIRAVFRQMTLWLQEREHELETEANELHQAELRRVRANLETAEVDLAAIDSFCSSCDSSLAADTETLLGIRDQVRFFKFIYEFFFSAKPTEH